MVIRWNSPKFGTRELELVKEVLESGFVSEGPKTKELEEKLSKIVNAKHIIMTTSATAALYLAIEADKRIRNYTEGEVIIPNLTFIATKNAVDMAGLNPKIVDVDKERYGISIDSVKGNIKIEIAVNLLGRNCVKHKKDTIGYMHRTEDGTTQVSDVSLICDNAGCLGSNVNNGKVGCYSLQANKLLTCGQGGFCATDDDEYAKVIRQIKDFGREDKDDQHTKGFNFKFNDIQAAVALGQLENLNNRKEMHIHQYNRYKDNLNQCGTFIEFDIPNEIPLWVEFMCKDNLERNALFDYLKDHNIEARKPWKPLVDNPDRYPNTDTYTKTVIWLPNGASLTSEQQNEVIEKIKLFFEENGK
jgi:perosamine synthetase